MKHLFFQVEIWRLVLRAIHNDNPVFSGSFPATFSSNIYKLNFGTNIGLSPQLGIHRIISFVIFEKGKIYFKITVDGYFNQKIPEKIAIFESALIKLTSENRGIIR
ncbi:hypothetical protein [Cyclobacterium sp. SYSU L10401]|uniref:hypothetical protein n=1 Tax=Cyclobacterium sp. SYSU L10401 TaxID=2678657 RepID=UPI0013D5F51B|nr:hypothetical protein [Cyclobacterium sp. SYSU L10401]